MAQLKKDKVKKVSLSNTKGFNLWLLEQKLKYSDSLYLNDYNCFRETGSLRNDIAEMRLSNDGKFIFICNYYAGSFK